jgi:hypothetical protein
VIARETPEPLTPDPEYDKAYRAGWEAALRAVTPDPAEPGLAPDQRLLGQCAGCWAVHRLPSTADYECECGERVTVIDLRAAALSDTTEGQS